MSYEIRRCNNDTEDQFGNAIPTPVGGITECKSNQEMINFLDRK